MHEPWTSALPFKQTAVALDELVISHKNLLEAANFLPFIRQTRSNWIFGADLTAVPSLTVRAIMAHDIELVRWLIDRGADVNKTNFDCNSISTSALAIEQGNFEIVKVLLESGASIYSPPKSAGTKPLDEAIRQYMANRSRHHAVLPNGDRAAEEHYSSGSYYCNRERKNRSKSYYTVNDLCLCKFCRKFRRAVWWLWPREFRRMRLQQLKA